MCRVMKDSGIERIGKIPLEWSIVKLGKVVDSKSKYPIGDGDHGSIKPSMYLEQGIPYIRVQNLTDSKEINWDNMVYISDETQKNNPKSILRKNDILIAKTGTVGKTCIIPSSINEANTTSSVGKITVDKDRFDYRYIFYSLRADFTQDLIKLIASQKTAQPGFNIVDMIEFPICKPLKKNQEDIANYLDEKVSQIDDIILKQKSLIEKYKAYKQSIITETVTKGLNKNVPMKDSGIEWIGEIPNHWGICKLNNVVSFFNGDRGKNYPNENEYVIEGIPFINAGNLENGRISFNNMKYISLSKYNSMGGAKIQVNDIVYCLRGTIGKNAFVTELDKATVASSLMVIRADKIFARFLFYILNSNIEKIQNKFSENGTAQPNLSAQSVGNYITILPNKKEQMEIADFLDKKCNTIDFTISKKEQLIEKLEEYKKSLIYECVTGKREVN